MYAQFLRQILFQGWFSRCNLQKPYISLSMPTINVWSYYRTNDKLFTPSVICMHPTVRSHGYSTSLPMVDRPMKGLAILETWYVTCTSRTVTWHAIFVVWQYITSRAWHAKQDNKRLRGHRRIAWMASSTGWRLQRWRRDYHTSIVSNKVIWCVHYQMTSNSTNDFFLFTDESRPMAKRKKSRWWSFSKIVLSLNFVEQNKEDEVRQRAEDSPYKL